MARIKAITFEHTAKNDGCTCDRCGQWITNIITVRFTDGVSMNYGTDCFEKLRDTGNLSSYGKKLLKKAMAKLDDWTKTLERYKSGEINAENDAGYKFSQESVRYGTPDYWYGRPYEEYRQWMIEELIPLRLKDAQKEIDKFAKVDFKR